MDLAAGDGLACVARERSIGHAERVADEAIGEPRGADEDREGAEDGQRHRARPRAREWNQEERGRAAPEREGGARHGPGRVVQAGGHRPGQGAHDHGKPREQAEGAESPGRERDTDAAALGRLAGAGHPQQEGADPEDPDHEPRQPDLTAWSTRREGRGPGGPSGRVDQTREPEAGLSAGSDSQRDEGGRVLAKGGDQAGKHEGGDVGGEHRDHEEARAEGARDEPMMHGPSAAPGEARVHAVEGGLYAPDILFAEGKGVRGPVSLDGDEGERPARPGRGHAETDQLAIPEDARGRRGFANGGGLVWRLRRDPIEPLDALGSQDHEAVPNTAGDHDGRGEGRRRDARGRLDGLDTPGEARVARRALHLERPAARQPRQRVELRQRAREGGAIATELDGAPVALGLVRLVPRYAHGQGQPDQEEPDAGDPAPQPEVDGMNDHGRRHDAEEHDQPLREQHEETAASVVVLEVGDLVGEDGRDLVPVEEIEEGVAHEDGRAAHGGQGERADPATTTRSRMVEAGSLGAGARENLVERGLQIGAIEPPGAAEGAEDRREPEAPGEQGRGQRGDGEPGASDPFHDGGRGGQERPEAARGDAEAERPGEIRGESPALIEERASGGKRPREQGEQPGSQHPERAAGQEELPRPADAGGLGESRAAGHEPLGEGGIVAKGDEPAARPPCGDPGKEDDGKGDDARAHRSS